MCALPESTIKNESVTAKATRSVKWSALTEIVSRTASPITFVIIARLLTPADFGVLATGMIVISFAQVFWDAGLSKALIQTQEVPEEAAHVVFWTNIFLSIPIYLLLFVSAPAIALFFNSVASGPVLRVLGLQIVIASLSSVQQALFVRELNFQHLFWIKLSTAFVPGLCSIPLAFFGFGVWALVAGSLAGQIINCWLLWWKSTWRPKFIYNKEMVRKLSAFGFWVFAESVGGWLMMWGDNVIIGKFLGINDLGVYRTGWMLVIILFGLILSPFLAVLYPVFSRLQDDREGLAAAFHRANRIIIAITLPMGIGLLTVGQDVASVLFGAKWHGLGFALSIIGFSYSMSWLVSLNQELYRGMGRPDVNSKLLAIFIPYYLSVYYITAPYGLEIFLYARVALCISTIPFQAYYCRRLLGVSYFYLLQQGKTIIPAVAIMAVFVLSTKGVLAISYYIIPQSLRLVVLIAVGTCSYLSVLWMTDRAFVINTYKLINKAILNRG